MKKANDGGSVLIVEDDPDLLRMMELVLDSAGFTVRKAENGAQALQAVALDMPRVILLDMKMPVMNGWEFAARFREDYGDATPIVVVTAATDARRRAAEIGATDFISKPFEIDDLVACVGRYLGE